MTLSFMEWRVERAPASDELGSVSGSHGSVSGCAVQWPVFIQVSAAAELLKHTVTV